MPYLTGCSDYPPPDPTVGGAIAMMSRVLPSSGYDFGATFARLCSHGWRAGYAG